MRIVGGEFSGKTLSFPFGSKERPTSDFLRETLFNLLGSLTGKTFIDLFAGSGSVGLEAASRGAREVYLIERSKNLVKVINKNIEMCSLKQRCRIISTDIEIGIKQLARKNYQADFIFADPPYNRNLVDVTLKCLNKYRIFTKEGVIIIQHSLKEKYNELLSGNIHQLQQRKYGENALTFFKGE
jgi:16S rRNA (guanine966-N2)-methyltransferase